MRIFIIVFFVSLMISLSSSADQCSKSTPDILSTGKKVYSNNCIVCHGDTGAGDGVGAAALNPKPRNFKTDKFKAGSSLDNVYTTVTSGLHGSNMAAFSSLSKAERCAVANYVLRLRGGGK